MSTDMRKEIEALHETFNRLVPEGAVTFNMARERMWYDWLKFRAETPFTLADLEAVVKYRRWLVKSGRLACSLRFTSLIGKPETFEEDLSMATHRPAKKTDRDRVLEMSGRSSEKVKQVQLAKDVADQALAKLRKSAE